MSITFAKPASTENGPFVASLLAARKPGVQVFLHRKVPQLSGPVGQVLRIWNALEAAKCRIWKQTTYATHIPGAKEP